ncbi:hypothetical protein FO519_005282 [Halicephalobus sp. NKZ332]|nr:hypothetical protein FO519_005282 [Halicephalobus sp. NKZ332]
MPRRHFIPYEYPFRNETIKFIIDDQYDALGIINGGGQGHIIKAFDSSDQKIVAVKKIKQMNDPDNAKRVYREFVISRSVKHRNLITLLDTFAPADGSDLYLVYEYLDCSMRDLIRLPSTEPRQLHKMVWDPNSGDYFTADVLFQLFCGLRYLHQEKLKFIHRDIKPENILFKHMVGGNWSLKICDLGCARHLRETDANVSAYIVTWPYRAPEVMIGEPYSFPIDLWSVGCVLAEMITGKILFRREGGNQLDHLFRIFYLVGLPEKNRVIPDFIRAKLNNQNQYGPNRIYETFHDDVLPNWNHQRITKQFIRDLLKNLLEFNPNSRLTAENAANLPHFNFLENRSGINDIAQVEYNPVNEDGFHTESEWRRFIREQLDDYEDKRFDNASNFNF